MTAKFETVTKLIQAVEYSDTRLSNCYTAVAAQAVEIDPAAVLADLFAAYFSPYMLAKEQGNKKLQTAIGRRWNTARTGTVRAMKQVGYTVSFPKIQKGGEIEITDNPTAAKQAAERKEQQSADDAAAMTEAVLGAEQQRLDAINAMPLDQLCNELESMIAASDHTPESAVAELINRLTSVDQTARVWAVAA